MYSAYELSSEEIIERIKGDLKNPANTIEGSLGADNAQAVGKEFGRYYALMLYLQEQRYVTSAEGDYLVALAREVGIERKPATRAKGIVRFYGKPGVSIWEDYILYSETQTFRVLVGGIIGQEGYVDLEVYAEEPGVKGNVAKGTITKAEKPIDGLERFENLEATANGTEIEDLEDLRDRTLLKKRYPGTSGNIYHYMHWALEVEGVGRVKVFPEWAGPGTVKVSILDANQEKAEKNLIERVRAHIDGNPPGKGQALAPIGATLTVSTAQTIPVDIKAQVKLAFGLDDQSIKEEFMKELKAYFKQTAYKYPQFTLAKAIDLLMSLDGVEDVLDISLNAGKSLIRFGQEEIPVVGSVVFNG